MLDDKTEEAFVKIPEAAKEKKTSHWVEPLKLKKPDGLVVLALEW